MKATREEEITSNRQLIDNVMTSISALNERLEAMTDEAYEAATASYNAAHDALEAHRANAHRCCCPSCGHEHMVESHDCAQCTAVERELNRLSIPFSGIEE